MALYSPIHWEQIKQSTILNPCTKYYFFCSFHFRLKLPSMGFRILGILLSPLLSVFQLGCSLSVFTNAHIFSVCLLVQPYQNIIEYPKHQKSIFLLLWRLEIQDQGSSRLVSSQVLSLTFGQPPAHCANMWSFLWYTGRKTGRKVYRCIPRIMLDTQRHL